MALELKVNPTQVRQLVSDLESEINNGGFDQFFYNSAGDKTKETIAALEAIGAVHTAEIVRSAARRFPNGMPPVDRDERQGLLLDTVSPESDAFEEDDAAFLGYHDDLERLASRYAV